MISGSVTRLSEATVASADKIVIKADVVRVTGSTTINTISPGFGPSQAQFLVLIPVDGPITLGTSGNIAVGITAAISRSVFLTFSKNAGKWYINSGV